MRKAEANFTIRIRIELDKDRGAVHVACAEKQRQPIKAILAALPGGYRLADTDEPMLVIAIAGLCSEQRRKMTQTVANSVRAKLKLEGYVR